MAERGNNMWICRTMTLWPDGCKSESKWFETKEQAEEHGKSFAGNKLHHEISRDFEVYEDFVSDQKGEAK